MQFGFWFLALKLLAFWLRFQFAIRENFIKNKRIYYQQEGRAGEREEGLGIGAA